MYIKNKKGTLITDLKSWEKAFLEVDKEKHWEKDRSAYSLANYFSNPTIGNSKGLKSIKGILKLFGFDDVLFSHAIIDRNKWNKEIQKLCFDQIESRILKVTDEELEDNVFGAGFLMSDLTREQLEQLRKEMECWRSGGGVLDGVLYEEELREIRMRRGLGMMMLDINKREKLREMIVRCQWTFAKTMPKVPHEYIVRDKCGLTDEEFLFFVDIQRNYGKVGRWGKYILPYLYVGNYKYWTMGAPYEETTIINRALVNEQ